MNFFYCDDWSESYLKVYSPYDEETAKKIHEEKGIYSVIYGTYEKPRIHLKVMDNAVLVDFINKRLQRHLCFGFQRLNKKSKKRDVFSNDLILTRITCRVFNSENYLLNFVDYIFNPLHKKIYADWGSIFPKEIKIEFEKECKKFPDNWTSYPEFGNYEPIIQFCRDYRQLIIDNPPFLEIDFDYPEL
ncbi:hypothetical protein [Ursidibacter arcticus]